MEQQKQAPSTMKVEIGGVEYTYELKEKEEENKCPFEVGDVIVYGNESIRVFEGIGENKCVLSSNYLNIIYNKFYRENLLTLGEYSGYKKATPEQVKLFKQKCLENGVWFDRVGKKWIELKEGGVYIITDNKDRLSIIFDLNKDVLWSYSIWLDHKSENNSDNYCFGLKEIINVSEATEEQQQQLFDALKEKGKRWNAEKNCVEDLKWKPKLGDEYCYIDERFLPFHNKNNGSDYDKILINQGNCFKEQEDCEKYAKYMRECSLNYKP